MRARATWLAIGVLLTVAAAWPASAAAGGSHDPSDHGRMLGPLRPHTHALSPSSSENLSYHGGPVMHSNTVRAIYWTGDEELIPDGYSQQIDDFFTDVATDSGGDQNVYSLTGQYSDGGGAAAYDSTFAGSFQDTNPLPNEGCEPIEEEPCVSDAQIRTELDSFISGHGLPRGLGQLYFVFLPEGYDTCYSAGLCAYTTFCAYHSSFGSGSGTTLYANQPWDDFVPSGFGGPVCGDEDSPNGYTAADHEISTISHEHNEAITDPLGNAWYDNSGEENGDKCAYQFGPDLGSTEFGGFNQAIDAGRYEVQLEWSNLAHGCQARAGAVDLPPEASFTWSQPARVNVPVAFDGSSSFDPDGSITGYAWNFGDGATATGPSPTHTYATGGTKTVTLTVTDDAGTQSSTTATVQVLGTGCQGNVLDPNDDGYTGLVELPFTLDFFGRQHSSLFVNNNGNVTFDSPLSTYTPFDLTSTSREIIAPFFGDVDTRGPGSDATTYGPTTFSGRPAFCVVWGGENGVGYYEAHTDKLNKLQMLLVDRSDVAPGDFDVVMTYGQVQWETGDASNGIGGLGGASARVGYSNGTGQPGTFFELPGSAVNGALLDSNVATGLVHNSRGSLTPGRYVYEVRNGDAPVGGSLSGTVERANGDPVAHAPVQACPQAGGPCVTAQSNDLGTYTIAGLEAGTWTLGASPPAGDQTSLPGSTTTSLSKDEAKIGVNILLPGAGAPPSDTEITSVGTWADGEPILYWEETLTLTTHGCQGGSAQYAITLEGTQIRSGAMSEGPAGTYSAAIAPLYPNHGYVQFHVTVSCPDPGEDEDDTWSAYIDPSGVVTTVSGKPLAGASVTLYRSDSAVGPFSQLAEGDAAMSPANRRNPDTSDGAGHFGWDVVAGYYVVRAERAGCHDPAVSGRAYAESGVLSIPPEVTDLHLRLACPALEEQAGSGSGGSGSSGGASGGSAGGVSTLTQPAGKCAGLAGKARAACLARAALEKRLAACNRKHGKQRSRCRERALAQAKCAQKKGAAKRHCLLADKPRLNSRA
ncbi:MAG TPA: PKD domain-containing protein [Solirubrobacterales bacterium]|nr:PKD domain-containing protein [Solirubrobacterales bacterium]